MILLTYIGKEGTLGISKNLVPDDVDEDVGSSHNYVDSVSYVNLDQL